MKKDKTLNENIKKCGAYSRLMPKSIKEAIDFDSDEALVRDDEEDIEPEEHAPAQTPSEGKLNVEEFVDGIRKQALKGMAQLADAPESGEYQILKKIWQICDKKPEDAQQKGANVPAM
jgi:hypothetical protein